MGAEGLAGKLGAPIWASQFHRGIIRSPAKRLLSAGAGSKVVLAFGLICLGGGNTSWCQMREKLLSSAYTAELHAM